MSAKSGALAPDFADRTMWVAASAVQFADLRPGELDVRAAGARIDLADAAATEPAGLGEGIGMLATAAHEALGLGFGPAHTEIRLGPQGPVVIEVNPRLAGGQIPTLVRLATGIDLVGATVDAVIGEGVPVGPFCYLRPGTVLEAGAKAGTFVEIKNSTIGAGAKVPHLSYIGDADVGAKASFGCGSVVVNYDGQKKHRTTVGERAFIGCNVNLVAPVTVGRGATIGAGTTLTKNAPPEQLTLSRAKQATIPGWKKPVKQK